jgi:5-methylcytosine-specific restriction endonuclease McrA
MNFSRSPDWGDINGPIATTQRVCARCAVPRNPTRTPDEKRAQIRGIQARYRERHRDDLRRKRRERYWRDPVKTKKQQQESNRRYKAKHKDQLQVRSREYRLKHRDELVAKMRAWRRENLEQLRARDRQRNRERRAERVAYMREWREANRDRVRSYLRAEFHKRRLQSAGESFSAKEWRDLCARYGNRCAYCGSAGPLTVDHRVPLSRGGRNMIENILPACKSCNCRKMTRTEDEFRALLASKASLLTKGPSGRDYSLGSPGNY